MERLRIAFEGRVHRACQQLDMSEKGEIIREKS